MRALLLKEYNKLGITDMPEPPVGSDDVLVRVKACGICGSEVHGDDGSTGRRVPPVAMGHEASGVVVGTGKSAGAISGWRSRHVGNSGAPVGRLQSNQARLKATLS